MMIINLIISVIVAFGALEDYVKKRYVMFTIFGCMSLTMWTLQWCIFSARVMQDHMHQELIEKRLAHYVVDPQTGKTTFQYILPEPLTDKIQKDE